jgi:hypothetical protein
MTNFHTVVIIACIFIGFSKGGLGGPAPVIMLTPLMSLIMPVSQAVGVVLVPLIIGDAIAIWIYWQKWDRARVRLLLPTAIVGIVMGGLLLILLANTGQNILLRRILGAFTLSVVLYKVGSSRLSALRYTPQPWHGRLAGWAAGFGSALANVGSPPFTAYMLLQNVEPTVFLGTTTLFFAIVNLLKLPVTLSSPNILDIHVLLSILWALPIIPISAWIGRMIVKRFHPKVFDQVMLVLLFFISLYMLFG